MKWADLLKWNCAADLLGELNLGWLFDSAQQPQEQDKAVAWEVYVELRTRITTQELHFLDGDESTALDSLYKLFQLVRDLLKKHGPECHRTAALIEAVLNQIVRPFTAKWHRRKLAGDLARDDACREFRGELQDVRGKLQKAEKLLYAIARNEIPVKPEAAAAPPPVDDAGKADAAAARAQAESKAAEPAAIPFDCLLGFADTTAWQQQTAAMIQQEKQEIEQRRQAVRQQEIARGRDADRFPQGSGDLVGLAVSGGGIRSATFALGVIQGLVRRGMLKHVDLLSTVSGGGYLGAFLSSVLNTIPPPNGQPEPPSECGPDPDRPPFKPDIAGESQAIRELRNHSRYILPSSFPRWLRTIGQAAYGVVSNLIILSTLVFAAVLLTGTFLQSDLVRLYQVVKGHQQTPAGIWTPSEATLWMWAVSVLLLFLLPLVHRLGRLGGGWARTSAGHEWLTVWVFTASVAVTAVDYLPLGHFGYLTAMHAIGEKLYEQTGGWSLAATCVCLVNALGFLTARSQWLHQLGQSRPRLRKLIFTMLWMAGPAFFVYAYFELCRVYVAAPPAVALHITIWNWSLALNSTVLLMVILLGCVAYSLLTNVNFTSLHRYYRNRLAETYLLRQNDDSVKSLNPQPLSELRATDRSTAPYHLINAALNLPSSDVAELRGRDCDFFLFSKHFCGSPVIGYQATDQWEAADAHLDLGTAVAISGAAAAPQMGMGSIRGASFLLTLLNVRLGYWLRKPSASRPMRKLRQALTAPGPVYLLREALNSMDQSLKYINVSDGGHIENLGMYELLRRRCKYIIAIDGECDPDLVFPSLMKLQQFAKIDLDVEIEMEVKRLKWIEFIPAEARPRDDEKNADALVRPVKERIRYSRGHFAVGKIKYAPDENGNPVTGWLIYVKLSITGNEPDYIKDYRRRYPDFPHESTADQIFEEDQFEAYRRLGDHITDDLFTDELLGARARSQAAGRQLTIRDWYQEVVNCFFRHT